jgi:predicted transcriptional regulator
MEVNLPPEVETKLAHLASQRGTDAQALVRTAIETFVDYDDWFIREVEKGLAQIDQGAVLAHETVGARLEKRMTEKQPRS